LGGERETKTKRTRKRKNKPLGFDQTVRSI
jgi:hypothetical protein